MSIFIADHTGKIPVTGGLVRPIHIGSALVPADQRGPEPDCRFTNNASKEVAYSDLRMHHYLFSLPEQPCEIIALMQHRRMYFFQPNGPFDLYGQFLKRKVVKTRSDFKRVPMRGRDRFLRRLSHLNEADLRATLGDADAIMSGHADPSIALQPAYLSSIALMNPGDDRFIDAWYAMRKALESHVGKQITADVLDGNHGYFHNTMITRWDEFKQYTDFLFSVLRELDQYRDTPRLFGYLAERILPVYVRMRQKKSTFEIEHRRILMFT